ncbi:hypothetical protein ACIBCN_30565 [Nocardia sp. NPDC051052]|uniref:hypothetical protein n=1 Tax=Nocardia sp. NPDC051052 TaxID=3364322 RepID=UPI0037AF7488
MSDEKTWRELTPIEFAIIDRFVRSANLRGRDELLVQLGTASAAPTSAKWIIDIKVSADVPKIDISNGPLPVGANVFSEGDYQGEILVWVTDGLLSGLEYAWVTDEFPAEWPDLANIEFD